MTRAPSPMWSAAAERSADAAFAETSEYPASYRSANRNRAPHTYATPGAISAHQSGVAAAALHRARCAMVAVLIALIISAAPAVRGGDASSPQKSSLATAAQHNNLSELRSLLSGKSADVNAPHVDGMTALHWAAHHNNLDAVKLLLKSGANANATNRYGINPISIACQNGHAQITELLLEAGADPNTRQRGGETPLMIAARTGSLDIVKLLLTRNVDPNAKEKRSQTAVMWAAAEGHAPVVDALINAGADARAALDSGFTPLLFAVREGRAETVERLLAAGVDVNEAIEPKRRPGRGPQSGMTPLLMAVENGHLGIAIRLVEAGANPNDQRAGYAALHNISWVRKPNHGEDEDGMPSPTITGKYSTLDFVRKLVALGADVNLRITRSNTGKGVLNRSGATPFLMAAKTADIALLKTLLELGADPTITTTEGVTPLIAAAGIGTLAAGEVAGTEDEVLETIDWLIKNGADVNAVDKNGETAMHAAAYKNLPKVVEFLASHGAKIDIWNKTNKYGWTPLLIAEGFRPGNFKPSFETIASIHKVMLANGLIPPPLTSAEGVNNSDFAPKDNKWSK